MVVVDQLTIADISALETRQKRIMAEIWNGIQAAEKQLKKAGQAGEERRRLEEAHARLQDQWNTAEQMLRELLLKKYALGPAAAPEVVPAPSAPAKKYEKTLLPSFMRPTVSRPPPRPVQVKPTRERIFVSLPSASPPVRPRLNRNISRTMERNPTDTKNIKYTWK